MSDTIKISDIAEKLGISRNTVSKALNGKYVPEKTKIAVLNAASELGYKNFPKMRDSYAALANKKILLLSTKMLMNIPFHIYVLKSIEAELSKLNVSLLRYTLSSSAHFENLKNYINKFKVDGIMCMEFFDADLIQQVKSLDLPIVFMDTVFSDVDSNYNYDIVMMENIHSVKSYCLKLIDEGGCRSFGFVGYYKNCLSFYERYLGMRDAMFLRDIPYDPANNILADNALPYNNIEKFSGLISKATLPDCFICANDYIALLTLEALKVLDISVPEKIKVVGFENSSGSKYSTPTLSTINVDKTALGKELVQTLINQMLSPSKHPKFSYINCKPVPRESTNYI